DKGLMLAKNPTFCGGSKESKSTSDEVTFRVDMPGVDPRDVNWNKISVITIPTTYWWNNDGQRFSAGPYYPITVTTNSKTAEQLAMCGKCLTPFHKNGSTNCPPTCPAYKQRERQFKKAENAANGITQQRKMTFAERSQAQARMGKMNEICPDIIEGRPCRRSKGCRRWHDFTYAGDCYFYRKNKGNCTIANCLFMHVKDIKTVQPHEKIAAADAAG
ncbi:MAG: hypothetical protein GY764_03875, partial [Halieaceae bacterium]|nr:hypothetical protein [Halieaceae bacterium]